jgi:hypothetical protein
VLAASAKRLARESSALSTAAQESQQQQITAHLIREYQHASQGDEDKAFEEFEAATTVRTEDIISRDIAAGWARRTKKNQKRAVQVPHHPFRNSRCTCRSSQRQLRAGSALDAARHGN